MSVKTVKAQGDIDTGRQHTGRVRRIAAGLIFGAIAVALWLYVTELARAKLPADIRWFNIRLIDALIGIVIGLGYAFSIDKIFRSIPIQKIVPYFSPYFGSKLEETIRAFKKKGDND